MHPYILFPTRVEGCNFGRYPPYRVNPIFYALTSHCMVFLHSWHDFSKRQSIRNPLFFSNFTVVLQLYYCSPALLLFSIFTVVLHLYCCSPALLLFSIFTIVPQLYYCSLALLLFPSFTTVLQRFYCFPALLLFSCFTVVLQL